MTRLGQDGGAGAAAISPRDRLGSICGILGPVSFVGAWVLGGSISEGYAPARDAISQLAREGAPTRVLMTSGFIAFGLLVPVWAGTAAKLLGDSRLGISVTAAGLATLGVAAVPLTRDQGGAQDLLHAVLAGAGYLAMAVSPLIGAAALRRTGHLVAAAGSLGVGLVSAACLAGTLVTDQTGLLQRMGLTVVDAWFVVVAACALRRRGGAPA